MQVLLLLGSVSSLMTLVTGKCPPDKGIYLMHGGYCLPEYTVVSINALTATNPLHCVLAGGSGTGTGGGQWTTGPGNTPVQCGDDYFANKAIILNCSLSLDPTNITLYKIGETTLDQRMVTKVYTCRISGQSINVQIRGNIFVFAIYIEPPADVRSVPQNYTIHCITSGVKASTITLKLYLENHENSDYTAQSPPPVLGYSMQPLSPTTLNEADSTFDYSEEVVWRADTVVLNGTEFSDQGLTKYNGDHDWACQGDITHGDYYNFLQTYIRAPNFTPTNLAIVHKNATGITISWTAVNASDADGYIMNITLLSSAHTNNPTLVDVGNVTQYTLIMKTGTTLQLTVRAYQDLLGPASNSISNVMFELLNWSLLSHRTSPVTKYRVYCTAAYVKPDHIIWRMNGTVVVNSSSTTISHQLLDATIDNYTNILTVTGDHHTQTISCAVGFGSELLNNELLTLSAPSGPPTRVVVSMKSSSSIIVSWLPPVGGASGYVILYSTDGASNMTQLVEGGDQTSSLLTGLSEGHLYTIRVFAYKDLPSPLSEAVHYLKFIAPSPVSSINGSTAILLSNFSLSWTPPYASGVITLVSHYIITYFNITCPSEQHFTDNGSVTVNSPLTSTLIPLQSGQLYNISVRASNAVGVSPAVSETFWTLASQAPSTAPVMVNVSLVHFSSINVSWGAVPCQHRNGEITGYIVMYIKYRSREGEGGGGGGGGGGGQGNRQTQEDRIMVDGHTATIDDLDPLTEYSVMVAGVNSAGTGHFSDPVTVVTEAPGTSNVSQVALTPLIGGVSGTAFVVVLLVVLVITAIILVQRRKIHKPPEITATINAIYDEPMITRGGEVHSTQSTSANADLIHTRECVAYEQTQASVRRQEKLHT